MAKRIAILVHQNDDFTADYTLRLIMPKWQSLGHEVFVARGPRYGDDADLALLHVDLTTIPIDYTTGLARYSLVINGKARVISKRAVGPDLIVRRGDGYRDPVIVKTDCNCGAGPERYLAGKRSIFSLLRIECRLPWSWTGRLNHYDYPVFDSPRKVPLAAWFNPNLVVQKFLSERSDDHYCLRQWYFLGDREVNTIAYSKHPIVKGHRVVRRERIDGVPTELREARQRLGLDYGRFDYGIVDGQAVLYDANRTPTSGDHPLVREIVTELAQGLDTFLHAEAPSSQVLVHS